MRCEPWRPWGFTGLVIEENTSDGAVRWSVISQLPEIRREGQGCSAYSLDQLRGADRALSPTRWTPCRPTPPPRAQRRGHGGTSRLCVPWHLSAPWPCSARVQMPPLNRENQQRGLLRQPSCGWQVTRRAPRCRCATPTTHRQRHVTHTNLHRHACAAPGMAIDSCHRAMRQHTPPA